MKINGKRLHRLRFVVDVLVNADIRRSNANSRRYLRVSAFDMRESALKKDC